MPGKSKCIWHARTKNKSVRKLSERIEKASDDSHFLRLDNAYLNELILKESMDFSNCSLTGATFRNATLPQTDFTDCQLQDADFTRATGSPIFTSSNLTGAKLYDVTFPETDFQNAVLHDAKLNDAVLDRSDFTNVVAHHGEFKLSSLDTAKFDRSELKFASFFGALLRNASLVNIDAEGAKFTYEAVLEGADFTNANLKETYFTNAQANRVCFDSANLFDSQFTVETFHGAILSETQINSETTIPISSINANKDWKPWLKSQILSKLPFVEATESQEVNHDSEKWECHALEHLFRDNSELERARDAFTTRKDIATLEHRQNDRLLRWLTGRISGISTKHGDSPWRIMISSGVVIVLFAIVYTLFGGVYHTNPSTMPITFLSFDIPLPQFARVLFSNLYFSVVTFTTLGYGDLRPATGPTMALASFESLLGALAVALLVFVLGRRATW